MAFWRNFLPPKEGGMALRQNEVSPNSEVLSNTEEALIRELNVLASMLPTHSKIMPFITSRSLPSLVGKCALDGMIKAIREQQCPEQILPFIDTYVQPPAKKEGNPKE
ncbi:hypothetical protein TcWFU_006426 [Taenia crassiceps]|uniref:Uncharacterized protein n=1 Tax=Taenia crassiceps TaxID=6207 RepID=A0ABR4Q9Q5_9CEST